MGMLRVTQYFLGIVVLLSAFVACDDTDDTAENPVSGEWRIVSIKVSEQVLTQRSPSDERITVVFNANGSFSGNTSVNQFDGNYELENTTLTLLDFTTTEVADTTFGTAFYESITAAIVPDRTFAQFGFSFDSQDLRLVFGNSGEMLLERE